MARVFYITQCYSPQDRGFLEKLVEAHDIWLLPWTSQPHRSETRPLPSGVQVLPALNDGRQARPIKWVQSLKHLRKHLREIKPDVVQAGPMQTGAFVAALSGFRPLIAMSWASDVLALPDKKPWMGWVAQFTLRKAELVVVDCKAVRDRVLSLAPLRPEQVICFPWGIDLRVFRPAVSGLQLRGRLGWESNRVLISTRRFEPIQGTMIFLEAMLRVFPKCPDVRVLMVGDGSLRPQVEAFIARHRLNDRFYLPGQVPEPVLADYYNEADLYVSATYSDGASISLLQAMACGLPVIVTSGYGNLEWALHARNGWLYPAGDAQALAAAIVEGLNDRDARCAMGRINSAVIRERANWDENVQQLLLGYNRILNGRSTPAGKPQSLEPSPL
jgi:glycosyltransferase involved in cell wall biosynthesis